MIDEDAAIAVLECLARRCPETEVALPDGAVFSRPKPDRVMVKAADAEWWLSLTTWGRLEMWGDIAAAGRWVDERAAPPQ